MRIKMEVECSPSLGAKLNIGSIRKELSLKAAYSNALDEVLPH